MTRKEAKDMQREAMEAFRNEYPLSICCITGTATEDAETSRYPANCYITLLPPFMTTIKQFGTPICR